MWWLALRVSQEQKKKKKKKKGCLRIRSSDSYSNRQPTLEAGALLIELIRLMKTVDFLT